MVIHSVYFWLKPELSEQDRNAFWEGAKSLLTIRSVANGYVGKPAETESRPIIDSSYDCALIVMFSDLEAHDVYQADPIHDAFRTLSHLWERVQIYDAHS